jgi:hypothetical protein
MATTQNTYTGDGTTVLFSFTFPYLETTDIKVSLNGTVTTAYTLANATTIQFNTAPVNGAAIRIYRQTDDAELAATFYPASAIRSQDLNDNFTQNLYVTQESTNNAATATSTANTALTNSNTAISTANSAVSTANTASSNASAAVSTANTASSNASAAVSTANTASSNATTAVSTANAATATANSAASDAATAISTANSAVSTANTASTAATNAVNTANSASSAASSAVSTANTASSNASAAVSTANTASSNATSAVNTANSALSTANAAASAVANAILYDIVANVAAIPASPANNDAVEVTDSTGIESFTPLISIPGGFAGNSGLSVRIVYTTTGNTWTWIQYFPNDPETRYLKEAVTTSDTAPVSPSDGDLWYDSVGGRTYVYYDDGAGSQWVDTSPQGSGVSDAISEGDTSAEVIDTGSDGRFVVTTEGSERLRVDPSGRLLIGTASARSSGGHTGSFQLEGTTFATATAAVTTNSNDSNGPYLNFGKARGGSIGSTTIVQSGDVLGQIQFNGSDGTSLQNAAFITALVDGTPGANDMPGRLVFSTTSDGTSSPTERLRIDSSGRVGIGKTSLNSTFEIYHATEPYIYLQNSTSGAGASDGLSITLYGSDAYFNNRENGAMLFYNNGSERVRIDSSGRLGIGTSSPGVLLHLNQSGTGDYSSTRFSNTGASGRAYEIGVGGNTSAAGYANNLYFYDSTASALRMVLDSSGRVGIGTSSPGTNLDVSGIIRSNDVLSDGNAGFLIATDAAARGYVGTAYWLNGGSETDLGYRVESGNNHIWMTASAERARIDGSGRLLVGTSTSRNSSSLFEVAGGNGGIITLVNDNINIPGANNVFGQINFYTADTSGGNTGIFAKITAESNRIFDGDPASGMDLKFYTGNVGTGANTPTERMRITNLGVLKQSTTGTYLSTTARYNEFSNLNATSGDINTYFTLGANTSDTSSVFIYCFQAGVGGKMVVYGNGDIQNTNNSYGALSDIKLKENIVDANSQWDDLKDLQVRNYNFKEGQTHTQIGLIAQEVELVSPGLVSESPDRDEDGNDLGTVTKSVNYSVLYMKAVKALQEAIAKIETLEGMVAVNNITIDEQQHQLSTLAARLTALESA